MKLEPNTFFGRIINLIRQSLWTNFIDYSLVATTSHVPVQSLSSVPLPTLLGLSLLSQSPNLCYLAFFTNFICNGDLLSLVLPVSALLYALLSFPLPSRTYWKCAQTYLLCVVLAKFIY